MSSIPSFLLFVFFVTIYKCYFVSILHVDTFYLSFDEYSQRFCFMEIYFTFDYRYCVHFFLVLCVSSSGEHNFVFFVSLSLFLSILFDFFLIVFIRARAKEERKREKRTHMCVLSFVCRRMRDFVGHVVVLHSYKMLMWFCV